MNYRKDYIHPLTFAWSYICPWISLWFDSKSDPRITLFACWGGWDWGHRRTGERLCLKKNMKHLAIRLKFSSLVQHLPGIFWRCWCTAVCFFLVRTAEKGSIDIIRHRHFCVQPLFPRTNDKKPTRELLENDNAEVCWYHLSCSCQV